LLDRLVASRESGVRVSALGRDRAGEMRLFRFLHNERVTPGEMVQTARARTLTRVEGRHLLAIQDTTSLRDTSNTSGRSLQLHPTIAVDALDNSVVGLIEAQLLQRSGGQRATKRERPFDQKQSRRWLDATISSAALLDAGAASVTVVADRESDIYEEFALRPSSVGLIIRAQQDRNLADGTSLGRSLDEWPELGREPIELPAGPGRKARTAVLALRARQVRIKAPRDGRPAGSAPLPAEVALWLVEAREIDPPKDAEPAHWRLLTTHAAADLAAARRIIGFYRQRWTIEQLFRIMKTKGFDIEASRVEEGGPFENLAAATLIASIQVLQMVHERDGAGHRPLTDVFDAADQPAMAAICADLEGKTARQKNPHPPNSLAWAAWICARLGGWTGYYGKPGPITIYRGRLQLMHMLYAWQLSRLV
jgi:Transposase DDE domain